MSAAAEKAKAEMRALAKKMLNGRARSDILESAYHRYAFHDKDARPRWFAEDEERHHRPPELVTKEEVDLERERVKAVDARPIKKVAEAKNRKRKRLQVRLETARSRAENILESQEGEAGGRSKANEINALYAKARAGGGASKKKPSRSAQFKAKGPRLDKRMLADKRQVSTKQKKKASKGRKGKGIKGGGSKGKGKGRAA